MAKKGEKLSAETRRKMSEAQQRLAKDPEIRAMRSRNAKLVEARKREEEAADPELAEERSKIRSEAVKRGWENSSREVSEETRDKLSKAGKGRVFSEEHKKNLRGPKTPEHAAKIRAARKGWKPTEEQRENMRRAQLELRASGWKSPSRKGITHKRLKCLACKVKFPREIIIENTGFCDDCITHTKLCNCGCGGGMFRYTKEGHVRNYLNLSHKSNHLWESEEYREARSKNMTGEANPAWNNWASYEPYDARFNDEFKNKIRIRQNRICAESDETCKYQENASLSVHHIDGNKLNSVPENCIALCSSHHGRAQFDAKAQARYKVYVEGL